MSRDPFAILALSEAHGLAKIVRKEMVENSRKTTAQNGLFKLLGALWLLGLGVALRLTWHHEMGAAGETSAKVGFCPETTLINCEIVNSSRYSEFLGVPIALFAIPTYLLLLFLSLKREKYPVARLAILAVGFLASLYSLFLLGVSHFEIGYFCLWCFALYVVNFTTFGVGLLLVKPRLKDFIQTEWAKPHSFRPLFFQSLGVFLGLFALSLFSQQGYRKLLQGGQTRHPFESQFQSPDFSNPDKLEFKTVDLRSKEWSHKKTALVFAQGDSPYHQAFLEKAVGEIQKTLSSFDLFVVYPLFEQNHPEALLENHLNSEPLKSVPILFDLEQKALRSLELDRLSPSVALLDEKRNLLGSFSGLTPKLPLESWLKTLSPRQVKNDPEGMVGLCAPSFSLPAMNRKEWLTFQPEKITKPTLLVFWSSRCRHCQEEIPRLLAFHQKRSSEFDVISITRVRVSKNLDGKEAQQHTLDFAKETGMSWPILHDNGSVMGRYLVDSTPTSVLISPGGTIQGFWKGKIAELETTLEGSLRNLASSEARSCRSNAAVSYVKPPLKLMNASGDFVDLQSLVKKPTLLHFWATWCLPCQEELPHFLKFSKEMKKQGVETLLVTVEKPQDAGKVSEFLKKFQYPGPSYFSPSGGAYSQINPQYSVPRTYLLGRDGEVLRKYLGVQPWENETFKELVTTWFLNY